MTRTRDVHKRITDAYEIIQSLSKHFLPDGHEDLAQQVVLTLLSKGDSLPHQFSSAWLYSVVRNSAYSQLRKQYRREWIDCGHYAVNENGSVSPSWNPERQCYIAEPSHDAEYEIDIVPRIKEALKSLSADQRRALALHAIGYGYAAIARLTGADLGTVRSRIHYARKKTRALLADLV